jgi:hypothetical protein
MLPKKVRNYFAAEGKKGGKTRAQHLTPERRREIARNAARARWAKRQRKPSSL